MAAWIHHAFNLRPFLVAVFVAGRKPILHLCRTEVKNEEQFRQIVREKPSFPRISGQRSLLIYEFLRARKPTICGSTCVSGDGEVVACVAH